MHTTFNKLRKARTLLALSILFGGARVSTAAEDSAQQDAALLAIPSELKYLDFEWARAEGDLNGDTFSDLALVLTGSKEEGARAERLVVLVGNADGGYKVLSVSGELCHPDKFYNLDIRDSSLFVQVVGYADSARFSGYTLQFRYSAARQDLELIGEQTDEESYDDNAFYRVNINFLTKTAMHTRDAGQRHKEVEAKLTTSPAILPLKKFDCSAHGLADAPLYIDEKFRVHQTQSDSE